MIKKIKTILRIMILSICFVLVSHQANAVTTSIVLSSDKQQFNTGDKVTVTVESKSEANIFGIQFELDYDPTVLELQSDAITITPPYRAFGASINAGKLIYPLVHYTNEDKSQSSNIATFVFKALKKGYTQIKLDNIKAVDKVPNVISDNTTYQLAFGKAVTGILLDKSTTTISVGNSQTLIPTVAPSDASNKDIIWRSSNQQVATVDDNGIVKSVSIGNATITATTVEGNYSAQCVVTCIASQVNPPSGGGSVSITSNSTSPNKQVAINAAISAINALPVNVNLSDKSKVTSARSLVVAAEQLGATDLEITNLSILVSGEARIAALEKEASDKVLADKAAADKAAADKAALEKAEADKAAADKAATEKAALEKATADKVAADKLETLKAAVVKAKLELTEAQNAANKAAKVKIDAEKAQAVSKAAAKKAATLSATAAKKATVDKLAASKASPSKRVSAKKIAAASAVAYKKALAVKAAADKLVSVRVLAVQKATTAKLSADKKVISKKTVLEKAILNLNQK